MKSKLFKVLSIAMALILMSNTFLPAIAKAQAMGEEEQQIAELAYALEFIFEEASIKNEAGEIVDLDTEKIKKEFPGDPELNKIIADIEKQKAQIEKEYASANSEKSQQTIEENQEPMITLFSTYNERYNRCAADKLGDYVKGFIPIGVITGLFKYKGKDKYTKMAKQVIKLGFKGSVVGIAAAISWITVECTWAQKNY